MPGDTGRRTPGAQSGTSGASTWNARSLTGAATAVANDFCFLDTTGGTFAVAAPSPSVAGTRWAVKWIVGSAAPTLTGTFSGTPTFTVLAQVMQFVSNGTAWYQQERPALAELPDYPTITDARYPQVIAPSGDTSGAADTANLNAALTSNKFARGLRGGVYYVNGPIILPSHSELDMTGCRINQVGNQFNLYQNAAMSPQTTAADAGAITVAGSTFVSATLGPVVAVGDSVQVVGAGPSASSWYGTVTAVNTGTNTITLSTAAQTAIASGATAYRFAAASRDTDITIRGGTWNGTDPVLNGHSVGATSQNSNFTTLRRIDGLVIRDQTWNTLGSVQQGGRFALSLGDVTDFTVDNIFFQRTSGDGVHVFGPASNGTITNVSGTTGDDMVAINTQDGNTPRITDTSGNLADIYIGQIRGVNCYDAVKHYAIGTANKFSMTRLTIDGVHGTSAAYGVVVASIDVIKGLEIRNADIATGGNPVLQMTTTDSAQDVTIRGVRWTSTSTAASGIINAPGPRGAWKIRDVTMAASPSGTNYGIVVSGNMGNGSTFGCALDIDGVYCVQAASGTTPPATFHVLNLSSTTGTIWALNVRNVVSFPTSAGSIILANAATTIKNIHLANISASGTAVVTLPSGTPAVVIRVSNLSFSGTNIVSTGQPCTLKLVNADVTTTGAILAAVGANATPCAGWYANRTQAGAGADASKDGSQTVAVNVVNYTNTAF